LTDVSEDDIASIIRAEEQDEFQAGFLFGLFYPDDGSDMFLRNVGLHSAGYTYYIPDDRTVPFFQFVLLIVYFSRY
jgi:hypothetical protein